MNKILYLIILCSFSCFTINAADKASPNDTESVSNQELWDKIFAKNHKIKISWIHDLDSGNDYSEYGRDIFGETWIHVIGEYDSIVIHQRNSREFIINEQSDYAEAVNRYFDIKYSISAVYYANFKGGKGFSLDCETTEGKKVIVEIGPGGTVDSKEFFYYRFRDGTFDNLLWCFFQNDKEEL